LCFSPDDKILAAAGLSFPPHDPKVPSGATNRLAFWEIASGKRLNLLPQAGMGSTEWGAAGSVEFSRDGRLLAVGSRDGWVRLYDFKQQRLLKELQRYFDVSHWGVIVRFSPDSRWLASFHMGQATVDLWDLADPLHPKPEFLSQEETAGLHWATFSSDNKSLITADNGGLIKFWNLQTRRVALTLQHGQGPGGFLSMAPDGTFLVSKDATDVVKIWRAPLLEDIDRRRHAP
jgi:WD40 repeat protein